MTWRSLLVGLVAVVAIAPAPARAQRVQSDQDVLMQLERDWNAAFHRHDVTFIESVLADEFLATYDDGSRGDRARELELAVTFDQQIDSSRLDEFTIKVYGDTAVVWFTLHLIGPIKGQTVEIAYRYTDVFVVRGGRWQCVSSQSSRALTPQRELPN